MSEGETSDERTILNYLNKDCWRAVLDHVPLNDIIRTERTSQNWQEVVLTYLRGVRIDLKISRYSKQATKSWCKYNKSFKKHKVRSGRLVGEDSSSFEHWTNKLGPSVVTAHCDSENGFKMLGNCLNLENLRLTNLSEECLLNNQNENFKWLKRLTFKDCRLISDRCFNQFMVNNTLEELEILWNFRATGQFLVLKKPTKLNALTLKICKALDTAYLVAASHHLRQLKKIELNCSKFLPKDIILILDKMPKLEHVTVMGPGATSDSSNFFETICRLKRLKYLCLDLYASDTDMEAVTRSCPQLRYLMLKSSIGVTGHGLAVACAQAGARLVELDVSGSRYLTDDDIVACIRACPKLKSLFVRKCHKVTRKLLPPAAAARRELGVQEPLQLHCGLRMWEYARTRLAKCDELSISV